LIDTDLRRPRVHKAFGMRPPVGITSVLVNESQLDEAIIETEVPNLSLLPCGPIPPNPAELLHSQRFQDLIAGVRDKFDRVVFDTPPIGVVTDALVVAPQVDGAVFVVRARQTLRTRAAAILTQLRAIGGRLAGVVLNDVDVKKDGGAEYYYGSGYEYRAPREAA
jgi:capsular exopolysaccharide synthesis family protein